MNDIVDNVTKRSVVENDDYKIVAQQGKSVFLLADKTGKMGRVLSLTQKMLFKPFNLQSILARGYWEDFTGEQSVLSKLLKQVDDEESK